MKTFTFIAMLALLLAAGPSSSAPLQGVERVFAADGHVCARRTGGNNVCGGLNFFGELGNGNRVNSPLPVAVAGLGGGASVIDGGNMFSCAVNASGAARCWGFNGFGQIGNGSVSSEPVYAPTTVTGLGSGVAAVATGESHACALLVGGGVKCWGNGASGRLGNGETGTQTSPVDVTGLSSGVASISASDDFTCVRMLVGTIKCWGGNSFGKLGSAGFDASSTPIDVPSITGATAIAVGQNHACALSGTGRAHCWGGNFIGQLGDGTFTSRPTPMNVSGFASGVAAISAGGGHTCALTTIGSVSCWGGNLSGQLGNPDTTNQAVPSAVAGLSSGVAEISVGSNFSCARMTDATARCWGSNGTGSLGDGQFSSRLVPADVVGLGGTSALALGETHSCAVGSGVMQCWGLNRSGGLGNGTTDTLIAPAPVPSVPAGVISVAAGYEFSCALTAAGAVLCTGNNEWGQLGDGTTNDRLIAQPVAGLGGNVTAITAGRLHVCVIAAGAVKCWGRNVRGQLGDGNFAAFSAAPVDTLGLPAGVTRIEAGDDHTCALTASGAAKCWGYNNFGQLGTGDPANLAVPGDVVGLASGVADIAAGQSHTCALTTAGAVRCWGRGAQGRLGTGDVDDEATPANVVGMGSGVIAIAAGGSHTCAVGIGGSASCWGNNSGGRLGDGTEEARLLPTLVSGLGSGTATVHTGDRHSCARSVAGLVKCWGSDEHGQVGDGGRDHSQPAPVIDGDRLFASGFEPGA